MVDSDPVMKMTTEKFNNTDDDDDDDDYDDYKPHVVWQGRYDPNISLLDSLLGYDGIDIITIKVENDSQLKQMAIQIFQSLKRVVDDGEQVATLGAHVKNMLKCPMFFNAFLEAHYEDCFLIADAALTSNTYPDQQRLENLKKDSLLGQILQETDTTSNIRGVLKIILGYWCDRDFFNEVEEEIIKAIKKNAKPKVEVVEWEERIIDLHYPSNAEGLKSAMATKYTGDEYERICGYIDRNVDDFDRSLSFHCFGRPDLIGKVPPPLMTWVSIIWRNQDFYVRAVGFGLPPTIPVYND